VRAALIDAIAGIRRSLDPSLGAVALTFDDGPDPTFTPRVLDALDAHGVRATFFLVGSQARRHPELVRRIASAGHAIGSHSATHPDPWTISRRALFAEYRDGRDAVEQACGREVRLFRPPKGYVDTAGSMAMRWARLQPWLWTRDAEDWMPGARATAIAGRTAGVGAGEVILLHDGLQRAMAPEANNRSATIEALPEIIDEARGRGIGFSTLTHAGFR
jgi:peptidoglycan/xylan/chitin deacetylase (PgdA/CDA1 family)